MATIQELLDAAWDVKETTEAVMAVRVALQNLKNVADDTKATVDGLVAGGNFASVAPALKQEGAACIAILNALVADLAAHTAFIDFVPDQG